MSALTTAGFHKGCIAGHDGVTWGTTPGFKMAPIELKSLAKALSGTDDEAIRKLQKRGFTVQGIPYALNKLDGSEENTFVIGRCKEHGAPATGVIVARTAKTVIVAVHDPVFAEKRSFGKAHVAIFQLAESLSAMNF